MLRNEGDCPEGCGDGGVGDPDLRRLVEAWDSLSEPVKATILTVVDAAKGGA